MWQKGTFMKVIAFNGSPRKKANTAALLNKALEGASSAGAAPEMVHLIDLKYSGCISCFECKRVNGKSYGSCALKDDLTPVLQKIREAGAIILGSPIYLGRETGLMANFIERLVFPYLVYDAQRTSLFGKSIKCGFIYTLGAPEEMAAQAGYQVRFDTNDRLLSRILGNCESLAAYDMYQFDDYSKYVSSAFSEEHKAKVRSVQFPVDCEKAFEMGKRLAAEKGKA